MVILFVSNMNQEQVMNILFWKNRIKLISENIIEDLYKSLRLDCHVAPLLSMTLFIERACKKKYVGHDTKI